MASSNQPSDSNLDDILAQTLEEFSIDENTVNSSCSNNSDQDRKDYASSLEQVLQLLSQQEEEPKSSKDYEKLLQNLVAPLSKLASEGGDEAVDDSQEPSNVEDDLENMMQVVVKQLLSKEILQEPMEQLYQRYCNWLEENSSSAEGYERYLQQKELVYQICEEYRGEGNTDKVLELLQEVSGIL